MTALALLLVYANRYENRYQQNIADAATRMIMEGRWNWIYITQYASGNSLWKSPENDQTTTVIGQPT